MIYIAHIQVEDMSQTDTLDTTTHDKQKQLTVNESKQLGG